MPKLPYLILQVSQLFRNAFILLLQQQVLVLVVLEILGLVADGLLLDLLLLGLVAVQVPHLLHQLLHFFFLFQKVFVFLVELLVLSLELKELLCEMTVIALSLGCLLQLLLELLDVQLLLLELRED